jgi:hypothetical protein
VLVVAGLLGVLVVVGLGIAAWLLVASPQSESQALEVPSLEGEDLAAARQEVGDDFELVSSEENSNRPKGTILSQDPKPGAEVPRGTEISVVVSAGVEMAAVPDVVGEPRDEAEKILTSEGFVVEVETRESAEENDGRVVEQSPSGGEAQRGSEVAITVGQAPEPAPGYDLVKDPTGSLTVEVPTDWAVLKGSESENPPGWQVRNWSKFLDEDITSSMIAAPDIGGYLTGGELGSGMYIVGSKTLAQRYTPEEAIYNAVYGAYDPPFPNLDDNCADGASEDLGRSGWSGQVQTWRNCRGLGITNYLLAATPVGGECMVFVHFKMASEADRETREYILNTFKVDCGGIAKAETKDQHIVEVAGVNEPIPPG